VRWRKSNLSTILYKYPRGLAKTVRPMELILLDSTLVPRNPRPAGVSIPCISQAICCNKSAIRHTEGSVP